MRSADAFESFRAAWERGELPDVDEFCAAHPDAGDELRRRIEDFVFVVGAPEVVATHGPTEYSRRIGPHLPRAVLGESGMGTAYECVSSTSRSSGSWR